ncbi:STAS domain-containing protein [Jidongwangia harbinensis]|uniref:STAS domain-containing protein n=1 Tax=Jidongwangia harbinensis TaxID=2878561 RepID=UPI001CD9E1DB|nr:STAS domain-containing protein [Jidongwangia harbinensis]MCA2217416.1 STAS domain-containing protein [Jidongwangia harbinensis]
MLDLQITGGSGIVDVSVRGELVMDHAPGLRSLLTALLNRGDVTGICLDLSGVTVIDAAGAGTLIVAHRIATNARVDLRLTAVSAPAAELLTLMASADLVPVRRRPRPTGRPPPDGTRPGGTRGPARVSGPTSRRPRRWSGR